MIPAGRYELPGYLIAVDDLEQRGVPHVAREVSMIVSLRTSEHVILSTPRGGIWELLIESGKHGLPDTYTFKAGRREIGKPLNSFLIFRFSHPPERTMSNASAGCTVQQSHPCEKNTWFG